MTQGIIFLGLLALASWPGEAQAWSHYNYSDDKYQNQFREPDSCDLSWNSYDRQREIYRRYRIIGREDNAVPETIRQQELREGTAGQHVGSQRLGNFGGDRNKGYGGGYPEGYGGGYPEGYAEGYGVGAGRGAGGGYDGELMKSPRLDSYSGYNNSSNNK